MNQLVAVAITIEPDNDLLASIAECLHQWAATHQDHTMRALDFKTKIIYLSTADIFRLLLMSENLPVLNVNDAGIGKDAQGSGLPPIYPQGDLHD